MTGQTELLIRLLVGTVLASVIGYERHLHGRPAGLRTHFLVGLASTTFMLVSTHFVYFQHYAREDLVAVDTSRIAASVVTGVGFLGGGAILRTGLSVQGLFALTVPSRVERKEDDILCRRVTLALDELLESQAGVPEGSNRASWVRKSTDPR